ncbi:FAD binding domain-containing protein [Thermogladius sp.]|uniref:FAD binding domain-containing protein n=1 Tax=Thermogladius sp. TaxID=2023064 RepID=UPI003D11C2F1
MFYKLPSFEYYRARSVEEAVELASKLGDYKYLAGGTDLLVDLKIGRYRPRAVIDLGGLRELRYVVDEGSKVRIGALTTLEEILRSDVVKKKLPLLHQAVYNMASWQIRSVATIGGNIANASPAADTAPPLLVHGALVKLRGPRGSRSIPLRDFILGPRKTALETGEMIAEFEVPVVEGLSEYWAYRKFGRRSAFTLSVVGLALGVEVRPGGELRFRVALNSVAPRPVRAATVEEYLNEKGLSDESIETASRLVQQDISPITDVRATAEYRRHLASALLRDALREVAGRLRR